MSASGEYYNNIYRQSNNFSGCFSILHVFCVQMRTIILFKIISRTLCNVQNTFRSTAQHVYPASSASYSVDFFVFLGNSITKIKRYHIETAKMYVRTLAKKLIPIISIIPLFVRPTLVYRTVYYYYVIFVELSPLHCYTAARPFFREKCKLHFYMYIYIRFICACV